MTFREYMRAAQLRLEMSIDATNYVEKARATGYDTLAASTYLVALHNIQLARRAIQGAERKLYAGRPLPVRRVKKGAAS